MSDPGPHIVPKGDMPRRLRRVELVLGALIGVVVGVGVYTFVYAKGGSYLFNDPKACANCHIMREHYDAWVKSSHHAVATCSDCHTPKGFIPKYLSKASNGFWHSLGFTTGRFPDPLRIRAHNREITEAACRSCHAAIVEAIDPKAPASRKTSCTRCHRDVGHPR